ncbi:hypothetical protein DITRI_Ditri13aG0131800 [Diplodiscus trichospermus]
MNGRRLRMGQDGYLMYDYVSDYFTIVVHHDVQFVNTPTIRYTGKKVNYFDLCHVEAMSMVEINDMIAELGYGG